MVELWVGVDVGGPRKGFDAAAIDRRGLVALARLATPGDAAAWIARLEPRVVGVDAPFRAAPDGAASRACERELARRVCGIRYTPDAEALRSHPAGYYDWILNGLDLYSALDGLHVVECFPTATWTRLAGPRGRRSRARWSGDALADLGLEGVPARLGQDGRDSIGAAVTARMHDEGGCELIGGEIAVPASGFDQRPAPSNHRPFTSGWTPKS